MSVEFTLIGANARHFSDITGDPTSCRLLLPKPYRHPTPWMKSFAGRPDVGTARVGFYQESGLVTVRHPDSRPSAISQTIEGSGRANATYGSVSVPHAIGRHLGIRVNQFVGIRLERMPDRFFAISLEEMCQAVDAVLPGDNTVMPAPGRYAPSDLAVVHALSEVVTRSVFFAALPEARPAPPAAA